MRRPIQSTDLPLEPTPTSFPLSSTLSTSRSRSLQTEASAGTPVGSTSERVHRARTHRLWQVYFGPITLGWFDEELFVIFDTHGNTAPI